MVEDGVKKLFMLCHQHGVLFNVTHILHAVAVKLFPQIVDDRNQSLVAGGLEDRIVKLFILLHDVENVSAVHGLHKALMRLLQFFLSFLCDPLTGERGGKLLQHAADLDHVPQVLLCDLCYLRSLSRNHDNKTFQFQLTDGLAHRSPADAQPVGEGNLHQALAGRKLSGDDRPAKRVEDHIPQGKVFIHRIF